MNFSLKHNIMTGEDYMAVEDNRHDYHQEIARYFLLNLNNLCYFIAQINIFYIYL